MSKINPTQDATLAATAAKSEPAKPVVAKPAATKAVVAKPVVKKAIVTKPAAKVISQKETKPAKAIKEKAVKLKMERDSFTMPKAEYAQFYVLKDRMLKLGSPVKKSEILRAGIMQLSAMTDAALKLAIAKVPVIKTGRPKKK